MFVVSVSEPSEEEGYEISEVVVVGVEAVAESIVMVVGPVEGYVISEVVVVGVGAVAESVVVVMEDVSITGAGVPVGPSPMY